MEVQTTSTVEVSQKRGAFSEARVSQRMPHGLPGQFGLIEVQRSAGNVVIQRMLRPGKLQTKPAVSSPGDPLIRVRQRALAFARAMRRAQSTEIKPRDLSSRTDRN